MAVLIAIAGTTNRKDTILPCNAKFSPAIKSTQVSSIGNVWIKNNIAQAPPSHPPSS
ncbi:MAG TPA: hypothetical protein PLW44_12640 [Chitinophagales bacterium]|nr:hypothetical protein [Chitinophagales bacterium]